MPVTIGTYSVATTGRAAVTDAVPSAGNEPIEWVPNAFVMLSATMRPVDSEEAAWADVAAHARASWAKDNPF